MNTKQTPPVPAPSPSLNARDVLYILFRHKWLIVTLAALAVAARFSIRYAWPVPYESNAELMLKWVATTHPVTKGQEGSEVEYNLNWADQSDFILNSEMKILTSQDVITQVVDVVGASRLLGSKEDPSGDKTKAAAARLEAAQYLKNHLVAAPVRDSGIIHLAFTHPDPQLPQFVLSQMISAYAERHQKIHQPDQEAYFEGNVERLKSVLSETDTALHEAKKNANISSLDSNVKENDAELARLEKEVHETAVQLAMQQSVIRDRMGLLAAGANTNQMATNAPSAAAVAAPAPRPPSDIVVAYERNNKLLANFRKKEQELLEKGWSENAPGVKAFQADIAEKEDIVKKMEEQYPGLLAVKSASNPSSAGGSMTYDPRLALLEARFKENALEAQYQTLTNQLAAEAARSQTISSAEGKILALQRKLDLEQKELATWQAYLDDVRANSGSTAGNSSISMVQNPSLPFRDVSKVTKASMFALGGGLALAFALPFLIELWFDQSLKRASEIKASLGVPFFITLPKLKINGKRRALAHDNKAVVAKGKPAPVDAIAPLAVAGETAAVLPLLAAQPNGEMAAWNGEHALHPFFETLRDRLMTYFEMINLTHKPKLVAVTSCGAGAGVTTTAAGLASSLSETGEGNVLLVDMNVRDGEAHHFYKGKLACPLEDVFENGKRGDALGAGNLYVAQDAESADKLPRVMPKRFSHLVPKMRASDYDYIIFDMPPISQISITPRLARFMDMVLLVVESEKTDREAAKQATKLLTETKTNVGIVLNKSRQYLPRRLQQEL